MPITNDDELAEALDILESPDVAQTLKDGVRRAAEHYRSMRLAGASPDTLGQMYAPTGIGAIEQGQEELRPFGHARNQAIPRELTPNRAMVQDVAEDPTAPEQVSPGARTVRPAQARMAPLDPRDELAAFATALPGGVIPGATELIEAGIGTVSPETSTEMREFRREHPQMTSGGTFIGAALPWGVEATIAKTIGTGIPRALPRAAAAAPNTVRAGSAALGAGTAAVTGGAMRDAADQLSRYGLEGVTPPSAEDAAGRFLAGAALGGGADLLGAAAGSLARSTRSNPKLGPEVERFERAGGELGLGGPKPSPAMRTTQAEVERRARQGEIVSPTDVALERVEEPIARAALRRQTETTNTARAETEAYNAAAGDTPLETESLLRSGLDELRQRSFSQDGGGPLPAQRPSTDTIRRTIVNRLAEAEIVPAAQADEMARAGAIVMTPDELQAIGIGPRDLAERATMRGAEQAGELAAVPEGAAPTGAMPQLPAPEAPPPPVITMGDEPGMVHAGMARVFGRTLDDAEIGALIGADHRLGRGETDVFAGTNPQNPGVQVATEYRTPHGKAHVVRNYQRVNGKLVAYHEEFNIPTPLQGQGIGTNIIRQQVQEYDRLGVNKIRLVAAYKGLLVWPLMGFDTSDPLELMRVQERFAEYLTSKGVDPRLVPVKNVRQIARYSDPQSGASGADFLLSDKAPYTLDLEVDLNDESGRYLRSYLGLGKGTPAQASTSSNRSSATSTLPGLTPPARGGGGPGSGIGTPGLGATGGTGAGMPQDSMGGGHKIVLRSRQLTPAELDQVAGDIDNARKVEQASNNSYDPYYDTAALEVRNIRDTAPMVRGVADETTVAKGYDAQGAPEVRRGLSGLKGQQAARQDALEADLEGAGLPRTLPSGRTVIPDDPANPLGENVDPVPALDPKQRDAFRTRITNYERTPGAEETQAEPLRRFADMAGVTRELNELPGLTAWQHLTGRSAASKAVHGVASGGGVSGYVSSGAGDFLRLRLDSASEALGGIPGTLSDTGARRALAQQLSPGLIRLLRSMRAGATTATGKQGGIGTQLFGLRGGPAGARAAATLTDEDIANLQALVAAQQPPAEEITE